MKKLIAIGKDVDGKTHEFTIEDGYLWCHCKELTELILPEGVQWVNCENNQITHLDLPESVTYLECDKEVTGLERYVGKVKMNLI